VVKHLLQPRKVQEYLRLTTPARPVSLAGSDIRRPDDGSSETPSSEYDRVKNGYVGVAGPADDEMVGDCFELLLRLRLR
jgi:hypothetical protein